MSVGYRKVRTAVLAGVASAMVAGVSQGSITVVGTLMGTETVNNGTFQIVDFNLTSLSGLDAQPGLAASANPDPGVDLLSGTFTATGTGAYLAVAGAASSTYGYSNYDHTGAKSPPNGYDTSYVNLDGAVAGSSRTLATGSTGSGSSTAISGNATAFGGTFSTSDGAEIELPSGPNPNPLVAQILVSVGGGVTFTGQYTPASSATLENTTFSYGAAVTAPASIISLTAGGIAPVGFGNYLGNLAVTSTGTAGSYVAATANPGAVGAGYYNVSGFAPTTDSEVYALKLNLGSVAASTIVADINAQATGVTASLASGIYTTEFPGYQVILTSTAAYNATNLNGTSEFAFNFANDTTTPGDVGVTIAAISAVPEPATAAGVVLGAAGLLLGRRKNRVAAV